MITLNGQSFDITYSSGISDAFEEQPGAVLRKDPWGMDSLTRRFTGRLDKIATELARYGDRRNNRDTVYEDLFAVDWTVTHDAPFPVLEVTFRGVIGGKPRDPEVITNTRVMSVTLPYVGSDGEKDGTTTTLKYYAPFAVCKYATKSRVTSPKYKSKVDITALEVIDMTGDDERGLAIKRGPSINGATESSTIISALANSYNAKVELTGTVESKPVGQWFENTEHCEAIITPLGLTLNKRVVRVA